ncbi:hypothetical protein [Turneriella parva]|uniref:Uncharacterized protein n=1 Tax=Turneriella parva (strain ATCC BAA-1111 / DSM 21527 / NCTC 11395 / H) TaxID=869212 RepID=I4B870_TURPD|nr:hypothetical protein [Turneriella parva]AFM13477.1 hypothetical protein Turpa_2838 [Turneriella parva DSM 21527]
MVKRLKIPVEKAPRLALLLATAMLWSACKPSELEFQTFQPKSDTALSDLFNNTPAIRAAFTTVNASEFNARLDRLIQADPVMGVKSMHALGMLSKERPALPQLADSVSSVIDRFARYYQATPARQAEYNAAIDLVERLLDVDPKAITDGAYLGARAVRYMGESDSLFPISVAHPDVTRVNEYHFPVLTTWKVCDDPGSVFLNARPESDATDVEGRDTLWALYDILRTGFCIYANRSGPRIEIIGDGIGATAEATIVESVITGITVTNPGTGYTSAVVNIDSSPGPGSGATATATVASGQITGITVTSGGAAYVPKSDNSPGAFMRNATAVLKNSGDVELRIRNLIFDLQNKLADYSASEKTIADWTVNQSNVVFQSQVAVTDYLIDHVYPITRKDFVFNDGKEVLDREAEHLSMLNPDGTLLNKDQYLTEWLLKALYADAPKLDDLENFSEIDTTSAMYIFGKEIVGVPWASTPAPNTLNSVTMRYTKANLKQKLWAGSSYTCNCTPAQPPAVFSGLLYSDGATGFAGDGYISRLAQVRSTEASFNPFRNFMSTRVNSLVTVPANYNNEIYLESALKNFYYHVLDRFYDQTNTQWTLTPEEAQAAYGNPERNLQGYVARMQYSMRNMALLDKYGKLSPGLPGYNATNDAGYDPDRVPYLTAFLYTIAAANGYVDPVNAPAQLTLQRCLQSMGSPLGTNGSITISMPWPLDPMTVGITNKPPVSASPVIYASVRENQPFSSSLNMFAFELITPGRFIPRTDSEVFAADNVNGKFRGVFSQHQGDIESTNLKTSNWMVAEFSLNAWEGYGPYSVNGRAANGSQVKYKNDFYTDAYRAAIGTSYGFSGLPESYSEVAMGENGGEGGTLGMNRNGNHHMYERIYRPMNSGDECWAAAQGTTYGYARYGWIRPSDNTNYTNLNIVTNNCDINSAVRVDFDTRDEAIRANIEWTLKYKKYIFVIPIHSSAEAIAWSGASFAVFSTINANGLWGVTTAKRAGANASDNGRWNKGNFGMGANGDGYVESATRGFVNETPAGGKNGVSIARTTRFGVSSFIEGDSMVLLDITIRSFGITNWIVDLWAEIWGSLGDGPVTPAMIKDNFDSVLTLAEARYRSNEILSGTVAAHRATPSMANFTPFFNTFFPTDETTCVGGVLTPGAGGGPDLIENYNNGCGVTARDLPPIPKVNPDTNTCNEFVVTGCIRYPATYNANGTVATWFDYRGPSDGKLTGMLTPLIMLFGTLHEDGQVMKVTTYPAATAVAAGENRDNVTIRNFCSPAAPGCPTANLGYRVELDTLFTALSSLNESVMFNNAAANNNLPQYNPNALTNILTESAAGLRNGLVPKLTNNKYANVAYIDPLIRDLEALIADNVRKAEDNFDVTSGLIQTASGMKNKDRLRYFSTKNAVNPSMVVDIKQSSPGIVSLKGHGLEANDKVYLTTTGTLPAGLNAGTPTSNFYYVKAPVTPDSFRLSETIGGAAVNTTSAGSGVHTLHPALFRTNRFDQSVNGVALNSIPINMMKQFVSYLRSLTSDAEIVAAVKAAIPMLNNYLANVQNSSSQISLTDADIDHIVDFIRDTNTSGDYSVDSFLDMLVATKMDDLNTLRSFNFDQFKTLGSYQSVFDDMNDKVNKYFEVDIKKDLLYSPFMLGEPTCPGGSANGFYDHNEDGVWVPGTFTFISAAYTGATSYTDIANVGGSCSITTQIPNIYDKDYYMFDMGGVARNLEKSVNSLTVADIDSKLDWLYGRTLTGSPADVVYAANPNNGNKVECHITSSGSGGGINFDNEIKAIKNLILCEIYNKKLDEPHYDRNGNNVIEAGEYTDINENGQYDDKTATGGAIMNLRKVMHYYLEDVFMPKYDEYISPDPLSPNKNYVHFAAQAMKDLLSPTICDAQGLNCGVNSQYLTADLNAARQTFYASTNFTSAELKSVKNVVGNFLYDSETDTYTDLLQRTGPHLVTVLQEFQGDYADLLNMGLEGFKPNGFMTYFSTNLTNKAPYTSLDVLTDVRTLFNTQVMRCYPGITGEYPGGPLHCKKYKALDTFWGQFGLLMDQFSTAAYNKYKAQWSGQMDTPYYNRLVSIFE